MHSIKAGVCTGFTVVKKFRVMHNRKLNNAGIKKHQPDSYNHVRKNNRQKCGIKDIVGVDINADFK
jgi:hypothetical protein